MCNWHHGLPRPIKSESGWPDERERIYLSLVEGNRRLAAAGVAGEAQWTEKAARKLATAIVRTGRKKGLSDSVIVTRTHEWIEKIITEAIAKKRVSLAIPKRKGRIANWIAAIRKLARL